MATAEEDKETATNADGKPEKSGTKPSEDGRQSHGFQAEVSKLLQLMVHSVYSDKDIFLRELISNSADACERLRYLAIEMPDLSKDDSDYKIEITADADGQQLIVTDNGLGMDAAELKENLGTIARSGTKAFLEGLSDSADGSSLIGQFGVGFYSAFMVADEVTVISRKAGEEGAYCWKSDGAGAFTIEPATDDEAPARGTRIILKLKDDTKSYGEPATIERVIRTYSAHVPIPILLTDASKPEEEPNSLTDGAALWAKPKSSIKAEDYSEFYKTVSGQFDDPKTTIHYRAEGRHEYSVLLFVPSIPPFDLFQPDRRGRIKLYVRRVFISDEAELLPAWLRFIRGVVDSEDLPLNLSREMLQNNPILDQIRKGITNRVVSELEKLANKDKEAYEEIWTAFGAVLKEGLYEDLERRDALLDLVRFKSSKSGHEWITVKSYIEGLKENQTAIYYALGQDMAALKASPHLEGFEARGIDVLLLTDPVDAFWVQTAMGYEGKPFKSVSKGIADLDAIDADEKDGEPKEDKAEATDSGLAALIVKMKEVLGENVTEIRKSTRLEKTAVCLVATDFGPDRELQRLLAKHQGEDAGLKPILELNAGHPVIMGLAEKFAKSELSDDAAADASWLLLDMANILDGEKPVDPAAFCARALALMA